jgi:hypothetical protein
VVVLVEDAAQSLSSADVEVGEGRLIGGWLWRWLWWSGVGDASVGSVGVVEVLLLVQRVEQVLPVPDQRSVEKFTAAAADPALHDRVHPRDADSAEDDLDAGVGEDGVEQGGELPVPVARWRPGELPPVVRW